MNAPFTRDGSPASIDDLVEAHLARERAFREAMRGEPGRLTQFLSAVARRKLRERIARWLSIQSLRSASASETLFSPASPRERPDAFFMASPTRSRRRPSQVVIALRRSLAAAGLAATVAVAPFAANAIFPRQVNGALSVIVSSLPLGEDRAASIRLASSCATRLPLRDADGTLIGLLPPAPGCADVETGYVTTPLSSEVAARWTEAIAALDHQASDLIVDGHA